MATMTAPKLVNVLEMISSLASSVADYDLPFVTNKSCLCCSSIFPRHGEMVTHLGNRRQVNRRSSCEAFRQQQCGRVYDRYDRTPEGANSAPALAAQL